MASRTWESEIDPELQADPLERKYPDKILTIDLEKLTQNQELYTKKIFSFCELEWSQDILKFYEKKNLVVKTLSNTQLRNKITKYNKKKYTAA